MAGEVFKRFLKRPASVIGGVILLIFLLMATIGPFFCRYDPTTQDLLNTYDPPSAEHLLGTDSLGRDMMARMVHGARVSLLVSFVGTITGSVVGAALGVAAHETGHALQHRDAYGPLVLRTAVVPTVNIGSNLSWPLVLLGMVFSWDPLINIGILLFSLTVLFTLITLPVEFNASRRAVAALEAGGFMTASELPGAKSVLSAAALTYVAAALTAILQLLRLLAITGRRRD